MTPFAIYVFPIYACNLKCKYCMMSLPQKKRSFFIKKKIMELKDFKKLVEGCEDFPEKIKIVRFAGLGEPLLHPDIVEMVRYLSLSGFAEKIEIITNGLLLSHEMTDCLVEAGLTQIRVSLQGICGEDYQDVSGISIDFDEYVDNLSYLYQHRKECKVNLKMPDISINTAEKERQFYDIFGDIADEIAVEYISPTMQGVDYSWLKRKSDGKEIKSIHGAGISQLSRCSFPFYMMQILPDGNVVPCCSDVFPDMGTRNVFNESIEKVWNGEAFVEFRKKMLQGAERCGAICARCNTYRYGMYEEDIITDEDTEAILKRLQKRGK